MTSNERRRIRSRLSRIFNLDLDMIFRVAALIQIDEILGNPYDADWYCYLTEDEMELTIVAGEIANELDMTSVIPEGYSHPF